jgi:outer membrane protein
MIKKFLSITALFIFMLTATSTAQLAVGYMNTQEVLSQLPERERVQKELESFIQQKQEELGQRATEYQDAVADYQTNQGSMSQQQIQTREQELTEMQTALDEFNQSIRQQIQQERQSMLEPIFTRIDEAIAVIAEEEGLDFVLNQSTNTGDQILFYASDNQQNITDKVVTQITSNSQN